MPAGSYFDCTPQIIPPLVRDGPGRPSWWVGRDVHLLALCDQRIARKRVCILAANKHPNAADFCFNDTQSATVPARPDQLLIEGKHQLPVVVENTTVSPDEHVAVPDAANARFGTLSMRTSLVLSPNWKATHNAPMTQFIEAWAGWLGEPAFGDDNLKMSGLFVDLGQNAANDVRAEAAPYTGWAGFNYDTGLPRDKVKEVLLACAYNDIRVVAIGPNMIDLFEEVDREIPLNGRRWILGHISTLSTQDIERIARMGLVITTHTNRYIFKEGHLLQKNFRWSGITKSRRCAASSTRA